MSLIGVRFDYADALSKTLSSILEGKQTGNTRFKATIKDGVDGSGGHAIYQQTGNEQTRNMIMYMF